MNKNVEQAAEYDSDVRFCERDRVGRRGSVTSIILGSEPVFSWT
jgi:hypothetical protein